MSVFFRGTSNCQPAETAGSSQDDEQPGPSRRKRQLSMSETMPLYTLCKEDLESMDKEVHVTDTKRKIYAHFNCVFSHSGNTEVAKDNKSLKTEEAQTHCQGAGEPKHWNKQASKSGFTPGFSGSFLSVDAPICFFSPPVPISEV